MNVLTGGRGGADLPEDEIQDVYEHLAHHDDEFDEQPPTLDCSTWRRWEIPAPAT